MHETPVANGDMRKDKGRYEAYRLLFLTLILVSRGCLMAT